MDPYSTHLPYLARAIHKLGGPVLELGAGWYSTPMIRALCDDVVTLETNGNWMSQFSKICGNNPIIYVGQEYQQGYTPYLDRPWNVAFVDCEFAPQRVWATPLLKNTTCIVCHDTENDYWNEAISKFKYVKKWDYMTPNTSYVSNIIDVSLL